jgi:hypothetical protein
MKIELLAFIVRITRAKVRVRRGYRTAANHSAVITIIGKGRVIIVVVIEAIFALAILVLSLVPSSRSLGR